MRPPLFTARYLLTCLASFSLFFSLYCLMPVMPFYVLDRGGTEVEVGIAVGLFTLSALLSRLFIGREVDRRGRKQFMVLGSAIFVIASVLYLLPHSLTSLYVLRFIHGTGIAAFTTASTTLIADIAPLQRRGEAISMFGLANNVALSIGPAAGAYLYAHLGFAPAFYGAIAGAVCALIASLAVSDRDIARSSVSVSRGVISRPAVFPAAILVGGTMVYGMIMAYLPLMMAERNLGSSGIYFSVMAVGLIAARLLGGRLSDTIGRRAMVIPGLILIGIAVGTVAFADTMMLIVLPALIHGLGFGALFPSLMAFTVDRTPPQARGKSMAIFISAFDIGIGLGTSGLGWLALMGHTQLFLFGCIISIASIIAFQIGQKKNW